MIQKKHKNDLYEYFKKNERNLIHKWIHYFDIYERHFNKYRGKQITLLEFGVSHGGSLQMWKNYFGKKARVIGIDINPECKKFTEEQIEIYIGSQEDPAFLEKLMKKIGNVDILIDDGGHTMQQQLMTFIYTYDKVAPGGVYLAEDLHTSYWNEFGGGLRKQGSFVEKCKDLIDQLNAWHSRDSESLKVDSFTRSTPSIHFYDSVVVFEKAEVSQPHHQQIGRPTLEKLENWDYLKEKSIIKNDS